jgi:hypothetical protein
MFKSETSRPCKIQAGNIDKEIFEMLTGKPVTSVRKKSPQ